MPPLREFGPDLVTLPPFGFGYFRPRIAEAKIECDCAEIWDSNCNLCHHPAAFQRPRRRRQASSRAYQSRSTLMVTGPTAAAFNPS
jgi:hypothetical protein